MVLALFFGAGAAGALAAEAVYSDPFVAGANAGALALLAAWAAPDLQALRAGEYYEGDLLGAGAFAALLLAIPFARARGELARRADRRGHRARRGARPWADGTGRRAEEPGAYDGPPMTMTHAVVLIEAERNALSSLGGALADIEGVAEAYSVTGEWDFVAIVRVPDHEQLADVVTGRDRRALGRGADPDDGRLRRLLAPRPRVALLDRGMIL